MEMALSSSISSAGSQTSSTSTPPPTSRQWRGVPGPSTRYHKSEHSRPKPTPRTSHTRTRSSLSRSSYNESSQSPLARLLSFQGTSTLSNPFSYSHSNSPTALRNAPFTPLKSPHNATTRLQGSPFSDYFTDDNHSVEHGAPYSMPSDHAQKLLLRLNNLGSDLLRYELPYETLAEFHSRLESLEALLDYTESDSVTSSARDDENSHSRQIQDSNDAPFSASDKSQLSEVWMADACEYADCGTQTFDFEAFQSCEYAHSSVQTANPSSDTQQGAESGVWVADSYDCADASTQTTHDRLLADTQDVVQRLAKANESLRRRFEQSKQHNHSQSLQLEELTHDIMSLKSDNDTLKSDLGFDHSELLFLKLQLQAIEVQTDNNASRVLLADDFNKWKADWENVDARLRSRREKNRVASATPAELASFGDDAQSNSDKQGQWQIESQKKCHGRVQSITIKRVDDSEGSISPEDDETLVDHHFDMPLSPVKPIYFEQSTQTEEQPSEVQVPIVAEKEHLCASCGDTYVSDDEDLSSDEGTSSKTPWRELCDGIVAFAGMQRD